jgi:hypothetical protein
MPDQVRHDDQNYGSFLNYDTASDGRGRRGGWPDFHLFVYSQLKTQCSARIGEKISIFHQRPLSSEKAPGFRVKPGMTKKKCLLFCPSRYRLICGNDRWNNTIFDRL